MNTILPHSTPAPQNTPHSDSHSNNNATRSIAILSLERGTTPGVLAVVAVRVGGVVINQVRVTNKGRGTFINFPARKIDDTWIDLIEITSAPLRAAIVECVLAAVRAMGGAR